MCMNKFEENLEAWVAGRLQGKELEEFEASLPEISAAQLEQQAQELKLDTLLKTHLPAPRLTNEDFFNHQLLTQIESEMPTAAEHHDFAEPRRSWWSIGRIVWT